METSRLIRLLLVVAALTIAGCAQVTKVSTGEAVVRDRLVVKVDSPWNQFQRGMGDNTPTWTIEGITVDALQFYVGLKDGELIAPTAKDAKGAQPLAFRARMEPAEIVSLYRSLWTRDGSAFELLKLEPAEFVGTRGFRFEYSLIRALDDVRLRGMAYGSVRDGELFLINYSAPRLGFYPRLAPGAESLIRTARVKG